MRFLARGLVPLALLAVLGACSDRTAILVRVSSPLLIPDDIDQLEIHVRGETMSGRVDETFDLAGRSWPQSLSLRPGPTESDRIVITVVGNRGGAFVVQRVARAMFVRGTEQTVDIVLPAECRGVRCAPEVDCEVGPMGARCEGQLPDAGPMPDAGVDAGCACTGSADCDDGISCTIDVCVDCTCEQRPDDTVCADGFSCDPVMGCPLRSCTMDVDCDDRRPCNGLESCDTGSMTCLPGTPIDCDDGDACTTDRCDDSVRDGACRHATRDLDGDGHGDAACPPYEGITPDDCDDANPAVFPGQPEDCNGIDDDCVGGCDEAFTCCAGQSGPCTSSCGTTGTRVCNATCGWGVCSPPPETCNAMDDDCNGSADDVFACVRGATEACTTSCGSMGTRSCDDTCTWSVCAPPAETCNGRDDDCDGMPDEDFACVGGSSIPCTTSCGSTGGQTCDLATCTMSATCTPPPEGCNGVDDDCDMRVDESSECAPGTMGPCTTPCGSSGTRTCSATCTFGACAPPAEACNGADDDCDGRIDEAFMCVPGSITPCATTCGSTGTRTCSASCTFGACTPPIESCNGLDDNCDTRCDESFACCAGTMGTCTTTCGTMGTRTCGMGCTFSTCFPPAEVCNGMDDDCNSACDDGFACCAGRTSSCTTSCGSTGSRVCSASCTFGACTPPAEACGGGDDDCDTRIDEGFACTPSTTGPCTTGCMSTGTRTCDPFCSWGVCAPPAEACNSVDDDCDSRIDEGCGMCVGCTGAIAVTGTGGRFSQATTTSMHSSPGCGGAGSEYTLTFTTSAVQDVFITTHGATVDTVLYVRSCACTGTETMCNNDADGRNTSVLRLAALPAGTYQVFVDTASAPTGTTVPVDIYISPPGSTSDRCGNPGAIPAAATTVTGDTCAFSSDYTVAGTPTCQYVGTGDGVERVYYFYLPTSRTISVSGCTAGTTYDTTLYIRGACNDETLPNQFFCSDDNCSGSPTSCTAGLRSSFTGTLGPGLYYLFVDGYDPTMTSCGCGPYSLMLSGF